MKDGQAADHLKAGIDAYARGTSVYFPDRAIPMLPEALSNGICSLNPNEDRLTKTVCIEFNTKGEVSRSRFFNSVIRSHQRMTYTHVGRVLVDRDAKLLALAAVVLFLVLVESNLKVTLRQPYPGIAAYFLWGLLLARLRAPKREKHNNVTDRLHGTSP